MEVPTSQYHVPFWVSLVSGGAAGMTVDLCLYPLDTIKTRMQAKGGFFKSGGFIGIYRGIGAVAIGSVPGAGFFFASYDTCKRVLGPWGSAYGTSDAVVHMFAASVGEIVACLVRVPTEIVKQRMQAGQYSNLSGAVLATYREGKGGMFNFYRGYGHTLLREIPFAFIQFPLYERLKAAVEEYRGNPPVAYESALCGSLGGGIAAAVTTPLDVLKTRIMLSSALQEKISIIQGLKSLYAEGGTKLLFAGVQPRVMWISIGGFFFFGAYETVKSVLVDI